MRVVRPQPIQQLIAVKAVHFVKNHDRRLFARANFSQHGVHGRNLFPGLWMADVRNVQQQIGLDNFFERGLERLDEAVR